MTDPTGCRRSDEAIRLSFPVQSDLMVLARITGATVAATAGFAVDVVEDFRLAVEELCLMVQRHREGVLHLAFLPSDEDIEVRCCLSSAEKLDISDREAGRSNVNRGEASDDMAYQFSQQILDSISDAWGEGNDGSESYMWFRMRAAQTVDDV